MHFVSSFGPSTYHTARYKVAIACQCNSFPAIISRCFCQHFLIFWGTIFGSHFWDPFLVPRTILKENLTGARGAKFKKGGPFWDPIIASFLIFLFAKTLFFTSAKTCTCWLSKQPFCTNMHKNLPGIELRWHEGKIIRILDLTSGTCSFAKASSKLGRPK